MGRLEPNYDRCRPTSVRSPEIIYQKAIDRKRSHTGWGAGLIWVELAELFDETSLPSIRTLQRWFHRAGVVTKASQPTVQNRMVQRGVRAHEVWALDAKEQIQLGDGSYASWLTMSDEGSGAVLSVTLFPLKYWTQIDPQAVKKAIQQTLMCWAKPERIRMDNGTP